ncbi:hypothetical protein V760_02616 [Staphylococcus aureus F23613]|uniref:DNA/RNA non-specific endonuclease n=1 Tax=Staphylococcus aureus TaxID=1280 RepID=UPI00044983B6|nr:DNA/RNA non-specific endonuclease [Staphylococcus aureus]EXQ67186.1 hypothetical protein V760_02616 [Staphylococcus aureus F23613]
MKLKKTMLILGSTLIISGCDVSQKDVKQVGRIVDAVSNFSEDNQSGNHHTPNTKEKRDEQAYINQKTNAENYAYINKNKTMLNREDNQALKEKGNRKFWADYQPLDDLGRARDVKALITNQSVKSHSSKARKRPQFDYDVHIAGEYKDGHYNSMKQNWKGQQSNNEILQLKGYRGYLYNKSHSLAWSLGGDMETHNLTLGTRAQNVGTNKDSKGGGMGYPETQIRNAIYDKPQTKVYYDVSPVYKDDELLPRGSHVRAYSVNDKGKTINLNVWIANKQKGVKINYQNGAHTQ